MKIRRVRCVCSQLAYSRLKPYVCVFDDILYTKRCDAYWKLCKSLKSAETTVLSPESSKLPKVDDEDNNVNIVELCHCYYYMYIF